MHGRAEALKVLCDLGANINAQVAQLDIPQHVPLLQGLSSIHHATTASFHGILMYFAYMVRAARTKTAGQH